MIHALTRPRFSWLDLLAILVAGQIWDSLGGIFGALAGLGFVIVASAIIDAVYASTRRAARQRS